MRRHKGLSLIAMAIAPFASVVVGLHLLRSAWSALLLYHLQIVIWALWVPREPAALRRGWSMSWFARLGLPCALCAPLLCLSQGEALRADVRLAEWLGRHGLSGASLAVFVCYYGVLHPLFEQFHWDILRRTARPRALAHVAFASYHVLVLALLLRPVWVGVSIGMLLVASWAWGRARERLGGLAVPALAHMVADVAIIGATYCLAMR